MPIINKIIPPQISICFLYLSPILYPIHKPKATNMLVTINNINILLIILVWSNPRLIPKINASMLVANANVKLVLYPKNSSLLSYTSSCLNAFLKNLSPK